MASVMRIDVRDKTTGSEYYGVPVYAAPLLGLDCPKLRVALPTRLVMETERYVVQLADHPGERTFHCGE